MLELSPALCEQRRQCMAIEDIQIWLNAAANEYKTFMSLKDEDIPVLEAEMLGYLRHPTDNWIFQLNTRNYKNEFGSFLREFGPFCRLQLLWVFPHHASLQAKQASAAVRGHSSDFPNLALIHRLSK